MSTRKGTYGVVNTTDTTELIKIVDTIVNVENLLQTATVSREGIYKTGR